MLVEINLLPEKETKNKSLLFLFIFFIVLVLIGSYLFYTLNSVYERQLSTIDQQIQSTVALIEKTQENISAMEELNTAKKLEEAVLWANAYPLKVVPIIQKLTGLLPERGFLQTFNYEDIGVIKVTIQFDTPREGAYYLDSLLQMNGVKSVQLKSIHAETGFLNQQERSRSLINENYLPRYIAEYEIQLNIDVLKEEFSSQQKGGENE